MGIDLERYRALLVKAKEQEKKLSAERIRLEERVKAFKEKYGDISLEKIEAEIAEHTAQMEESYKGLEELVNTLSMKLS